MIACKECGKTMVCLKNGVVFYAGSFRRRGDVYECKGCGKKIVFEWGDGYSSNFEVKPNVFDREVNGLEFDLFQEHPYCYECENYMEGPDLGYVVLPQEHDYKKCDIYTCKCGRIGYWKHSSWGYAGKPAVEKLKALYNEKKVLQLK